MSWRRQARIWAASRGKEIRRVAAQGFQRSVQAGRVAAHRVIAVQKAARLPQHLMRRSAVSVATREPARVSDAAWRDGYMQAAARQLPRVAARQPVDREAGQ